MVTRWRMVTLRESPNHHTVKSHLIGRSRLTGSHLTGEGHLTGGGRLTGGSHLVGGNRLFIIRTETTPMAITLTTITLTIIHMAIIHTNNLIGTNYHLDHLLSAVAGRIDHHIINRTEGVRLPMDTHRYCPIVSRLVGIVQHDHFMMDRLHPKANCL
jgi:hypothetical protein